MSKKFILVFLMVLGVSFTALANTLTDTAVENEVTQEVVIDGELVVTEVLGN